MALSLPKFAKDGSLALIRRLIMETGREFAWQYALVIALSIVIAGTMAFNTWLIKDVVDQVFFARRADMLYWLTALVIAIAFARGAALYYSAVILGRIGNAIVARIQRRLFDHLLNLGIDFYNRTPSSDVITRMSHNAQAARMVLDTVITNVGRDFLTVLGLVIVMVIQAPLLSIIVLIVGPIAIIGVGKLMKRVRGVARDQFTSLSMVVSDVQETVQGMRIVKAYNLESAMRKRMAKSIELVRQRADKIVRIGARTSPLMETLGGVAAAVIILYAGYQTIYFNQPPGAFMSFLAAIGLAYEPAKRLAKGQITIEANLVGVRMMYELLDTSPGLDINADGPDLVLSGGAVVFDRVDFAYRDAAPVFRGLDFTAAAGKMTALVGPSGAGKSTIIALIERFFDVGGGRVLVDGQDTAQVKLSSLRDQTALVSQDIVLFRDTVRENIRFGRPDASDAEVEEAARDAMAHDFILAMAEGYDTILGDQATELSGGQRQRVAIARAMLRDAAIVLLDEATSALDTESEHKVQAAFDRLTEGRTTIVIAHRLSTVLGADKICVLVDGKIVEEGRHSELLALDRHYARLYHLQFERHGSRRPDGDDATEAVTVAAQ
jgi:ATP-binding cassette, subfamily B, bacterial MsbA